MYAPVTGYYSLSYGTYGMERTENACSTAATTGCSCDACPT